MIKQKCFWKYKGCEEYTPKNSDGTRTVNLYKFEDDEGHVEKFNGNFELLKVDVSELTEDNIDKWFQCTFDFNKSFKSGRTYSIFKSITKIKENN